MPCAGLFRLGRRLCGDAPVKASRPIRHGRDPEGGDELPGSCRLLSTARTACVTWRHRGLFAARGASSCVGVTLANERRAPVLYSLNLGVPRGRGRACGGEAGGKAAGAWRKKKRQAEDGEKGRSREREKPRRRKKKRGWTSRGGGRRTGSAGGRTSASARGERCARTTRPTGPPGTICPTTQPGPRPIAGTRTAWPASADRHQLICFALALWNGRDPILKERLFGLSGSEGNHGEDVKEQYFYLDSTPDALLHEVPVQVPAGGLPLRANWCAENKKRGRARAGVRAAGHRRLRRGPLLRRVRGVRQGRRRTTSASGSPPSTGGRRRPRCTSCPRSGSATPGPGDTSSARTPADAWRSARRSRTIAVIEAVHPYYGPRWLTCEGRPPLLFTENETNAERLYGSPNPTPYVKDGINDYVVEGQAGAVNPQETGTKAAAHYALRAGAGRDGDGAPALDRLRTPAAEPGRSATSTPFSPARRAEADEFYAGVIPARLSPDADRA